MSTLRNTLSVLCLAAALGGRAVCAADSAPPAPPITPEPPSGPEAPAMPADGSGAAGMHHPGLGGGLLFVLHELNLTVEQKARVKAILAQQKTEFHALHAAIEANRHSLATTAPTDPGYPALVQTAQANAALRIKLETDTWTAIYTGVLTEQQQQAIPALVNAAEQARAEREAEWKALRD